MVKKIWFQKNQSSSLNKPTMLENESLPIPSTEEDGEQSGNPHYTERKK